MAEFTDPDALPPLGFISIDLDIHRPPGDPYNEKTWPFPLIREMAEGSKVSQVVSSDQYDSAFIDRFVDAGLRLAARGCVGIITSCGFLAMAQADCVGVLTYDETKLGPKHLASFVPDSWMSRVIVRGVPPGGHLRNIIRENGAPYVHADIEAELVATAKELIKGRPDIRAVVLECTNMPPSSKAIHAGLGGKIPVYDVYTMGRWFYSGLARQTPPGWVV
ncbi:aspartate racemase protein [Colletotrichum asianum]